MTVAERRERAAARERDRRKQPGYNERRAEWARSYRARLRIARLQQHPDVPLNVTTKARVCEACELVFQPDSNHQRLCRICVPDKKALRLYRAYGLTWPMYQMMMAEPCPLCGRAATVVDHDHADGRVRGALCHGCNLGLNRFEDADWRDRALRYINDKQAAMATGMLAAGRRTARRPK